MENGIGGASRPVFVGADGADKVVTAAEAAIGAANVTRSSAVIKLVVPAGGKVDCNGC